MGAPLESREMGGWVLLEQIERIDYPKVPIDTTGTDAVGNRADQLPPGRRNTRFGGPGPAFFGAGPAPRAAAFPGLRSTFGR